VPRRQAIGDCHSEKQADASRRLAPSHAPQQSQFIAAAQPVLQL